MSFKKPTKQTLVFLLLLFIAVQAAVTVIFGSAAGTIVIGALAALAVVFIIQMYFTLSAKLDGYAQSLNLDHIQTTRQVQSLFYVFSLLKFRRPLPPMRDMAISPDFAATLVSKVLEERPKTILEFGSGTSTLLCGYCLEQIGAGRIISIDHEGKYAEQTRESLREHTVDRFATVVHAPIREVQLPSGKWQWYDTSFISELPEINLLIVDGPPAWLQDLARYPALPLILKHLSPSATVLIDDADRPDEQEMVSRWLTEFPGFSQSHLMHEKGTVVLKRTIGVRTDMGDRDDAGVRSGAGA